MTQKKSPSKASRSRKRGRPRKSVAAKRLACTERGMFLANKVTGRCRKTSRARKVSSKSSSRKSSSRKGSKRGRPRKSLAAKRLACKERGMFLANKVTGRCRKTRRSKKSSRKSSSKLKMD